MQVSRNDTTLAHALAKRAIDSASEKLHGGIGLYVLNSNSVKAFFRNVTKHFPGRVIDANVGRVIGSRATASVLMCDTDTGNNLALTQLIFNARRPANQRVMPHPVPIVVQTHALARIIQRITGKGDLAAAVTSIQPHLYAASEWVRANYPMEPKTELAISGLGLELAGSVDTEGTLRLKTAIDADSMAHLLRRGWAMSDQVSVRVTFEPK